MKKMRYRVLGLILTLAMMTGLLSACGGYDPVQEALGYSGSTEMLSVNGSKVTASDLMFWMAQAADELNGYFDAMGGGEAVDWSMDMGGGTAAEMVKERAKSSAIMYSIISSQSLANGYSLSKEDKALYQEELDKAIESTGGEENYDTYLHSMLITADDMERLSSVGVLFDQMAQGMCRDGGQYAPQEGELEQYVKDNDLLCAKHILLLTKDPSTQKPLDDKAKAEKKAKAEEMAAELQGIQDAAQRQAKFTELMKTNSEDPGLEQNPNGYVFSAGQMVKEFEEGTRALKPGQVSDVIESEYGYHIIYREDPLAMDELVSGWATDKMYEVVGQWIEQAQVEEAQAFKDLDVADFYTKLETYRDTLKGENPEAAPADGAPAQEPPADGQPADGQPAGEKPAEGEAPAQEKPAE